MDDFIFGHFMRSLHRSDFRKCNRFIKRYGNPGKQYPQDLYSTVYSYLRERKIEIIDYMIDQELISLTSVISTINNELTQWQDRKSSYYYKSFELANRFFKLKDL